MARYSSKKTRCERMIEPSLRRTSLRRINGLTKMVTGLEWRLKAFRRMRYPCDLITHSKICPVENTSLKDHQAGSRNEVTPNIRSVAVNTQRRCQPHVWWGRDCQRSE